MSGYSSLLGRSVQVDSSKASSGLGEETARTSSSGEEFIFRALLLELVRNGPDLALGGLQLVEARLQFVVASSQLSAAKSQFVVAGSKFVFAGSQLVFTGSQFAFTGSQFVLVCSGVFGVSVKDDKATSCGGLYEKDIALGGLYEKETVCGETLPGGSRSEEEDDSAALSGRNGREVLSATVTVSRGMTRRHIT